MLYVLPLCNSVYVLPLCNSVYALLLLVLDLCGYSFSEKYVVALQQMGLPKDNEKINQTFVTFTVCYRLFVYCRLCDCEGECVYSSSLQELPLSLFYYIWQLYGE